ncbi:MAG: hypothetical protein LUG25_03540 [Oscillospiraceae bacterium]|nr:hypothetical protein [Oscillospiraceae bacterium]
MGNFESMNLVAFTADAAKNEEDASMIRRTGFIMGLATQQDDDVSVSTEELFASQGALPKTPFMENMMAIFLEEGISEELEAALPVLACLVSADMAGIYEVMQDDAVREIIFRFFESPQGQRIAECIEQNFDFEKIMPQEEES